MKAVRIALWALLLVLAAIGIVIASLPAYLEAHKDVLAGAASRALGRSVRIEGAVGVAWLPRPSLVLKDIEIAGAEGSAAPGPWHAGRLEGDLDLAALFDRQLRIGRIQVQDAVIHLDPDQLAGWAPSDPPSSRGGFRVTVDSVRLVESTLVLQTASDPPRSFRIDRLDLTGLDGSSPGPSLDLEGEIAVSGTRVGFSVLAGPLDESASSRWPFALRMQVADASLEASGSTGALFDFAQIEARVDLAVPDLKALQPLLPTYTLPAAGGLRMSGRLLRGDDGLALDRIEGFLDASEPLGRITLADGAARQAANGLTCRLEGQLRQTPLRLELGFAGLEEGQPFNPLEAGSGRLQLLATLGDARLLGDLSLTPGGPRPSIEGSLNIEKLDLRAPGSFNRSPATTDEAPTWLDRPIPVERLRDLDLNLALRIEGLETDPLKIERLAARVTLDDGRLRLGALDVVLPGITLAGDATLDARQARPAWAADLKAERILLPEALAFLPSAKPPGGRLDTVSLAAKAQGATARALIASLTGELGAKEAQFRAPAANKQAATPIKLTKPRLTLKPGTSVRLQTALAAGTEQFELDISGGRLGDLLPKGRGWPKIDVLAKRRSKAQGAEIRGHVGPLDALLAGRDLNLDLSFKQPGITIGAKGRLARLDALRGSTLDVEAAVQDLSVLGDLVGGPLGQGLASGLPVGPPVTASARLRGLDEGWELRDLKAASGDSDLAGNLTIRPGPTPRIEATLSAQRLDLTPYVRTASPAGSARSTPAQLPAPELLRMLDGTLRLKVDHLKAGDIGLDLLDLDAALDSGHLQASIATGADRLRAEIDLRPDRAGWRFDIRAKGNLDLAYLLEAKDANTLSHIQTALDTRLTGVATAWNDLLRNADGHLELSLGAGRLHKKAAEVLPLGGLLFTLLDVLNPIALDLDSRVHYNELQCAVLQFDLAEGIATSTRGLAVQTKTLNAIGGGALNLRTEAIELRFKTAKRRGIGLSLLGIADRFVYVKGTLRKPRAGIDPAALLTHGGAAWATTGISLLADQLVRRLTSGTNPCDAVGTQR
ncbi:AsmA family protein [Thiocapsa sp.]|uniref:AsmA family protein n=1 Tax=Thiocapsa sp. TaxID=2024551 RepID=UPI002B612F81|nr:AsmA family protein [Thiocapsa sp.]HSO81525.1 AsmA family protein [Thiocapsa sp.]